MPMASDIYCGFNTHKSQQCASLRGKSLPLTQWMAPGSAAKPVEGATCPSRHHTERRRSDPASVGTYGTGQTRARDRH